LEEKTVTGFDFSARKQLQHLIRIQLEAEEATSSSPVKPVLITDNDESQADEVDARMQALGPPPGLELEDGRFLSTSYPSARIATGAAR
jgi:hypothetical protein